MAEDKYHVGGSADRLFDVAMALFAQYGYDNVTTAEIADAAGVTQRTLFRHYPAKVDLLLRDAERMTDAFFQALFRQPSELTIVEALAAGIAEHLATELNIEDSIRIMRISRSANSLQGPLAAYQQSLESRFAAWIAQRHGLSQEDLQVRSAAAMLIAARRVALDECISLYPSVDDTIEIVNSTLSALQILHNFEYR